MKTREFEASMSALSSIVTTAIGDCREEVKPADVQEMIAVTAKALAVAVTVLQGASGSASESCRADS